MTDNQPQNLTPLEALKNKNTIKKVPTTWQKYKYIIISATLVTTTILFLAGFMIGSITGYKQGYNTKTTEVTEIINNMTSQFNSNNNSKQKLDFSNNLSQNNNSNRIVEEEPKPPTEIKFGNTIQLTTIDFKIDKFTEIGVKVEQTASYNKGKYITAKDGTKFVRIDMVIKNKEKEEKYSSFEDIFALYDQDDNRYTENNEAKIYAIKSEDKTSKFQPNINYKNAYIYEVPVESKTFSVKACDKSKNCYTQKLN